MPCQVAKATGLHFTRTQHMCSRMPKHDRCDHTTWQATRYSALRLLVSEHQPPNSAERHKAAEHGSRVQSKHPVH